MALSRAELKMVIKECLIELLSEGLGNVQSSASRPPAPGRVPINGAIREQRTANGRRRPDFDPKLDTPLQGGRQATNALKEAIKRESGGNPMMAAILADTAMTTLPTQLSNGDSMGSPAAGSSGTSPISREHAPNQQEQFTGNPDEIFEGATPRADGSSHWADLAFMGPGKKSA
jgi:hypothetical protein